MHQNSKYRDFLTGITPEIGKNTGFSITKGILYRANEFAKKDDSAALLIIDELNRGPAIEVFGGSIVAIESDKRLADDNNVLPTTQFFEILSPDDAQMEEYAFSPNLYILAAMNQADVSIAPLDVAFLRRWYIAKIQPDYTVLYNHFNVKSNEQLPEEPLTISDVYGVAIRALEKINEAIVVGRGEDYQLGQGVFLSTNPKDNSINSALSFITQAWNTIYSHLEELFFGDNAALAFVVNANSELSPYYTEEKNFAGETKLILSHDEITEQNVYAMYFAITGLEI